MKMTKCFELHNTLRSSLGDDLVYSLVMDGHQYLLAVSCHKSTKQRFTGGHRMRTLILTEEDLQLSVAAIAVAVKEKLDTVLEAIPTPEDTSTGLEGCTGCGDSNVTQ